ncbi:MAG: 1-deoxy-D-xylulose-5-phosphate reductoisomerase [Parachlamydiales bacterium]|nr:1-deoxy-D-xylulose-5-phosphate reductoisomerase [Parachlamydiales bacterium]
MKKIAILGSTGSIGKSTLKVVKESPDLFKVVAICANSNIDEIEKQAKIFNPKLIAVFNEEKAKELKKRLSGDFKIVSGLEGLNEVASYHEADFVMSAISGSIGLIPTISAIKAKKTIGLANKEVLVSAGELVKKLLNENNVKLLPVDSEHSAIFQCLKNEENKEIKRLIITASGGPFLNTNIKDFNKISLIDALKHPNFQMGKKITIDSATMMNKGLEVIEAYHLFQIKKDQIDVIVHPEQIIHSMVEFIDGSILAQMSEPTMEIPIRYSLSYPKRIHADFKNFDFLKNHSLTFKKPDLEKFLCLKLAIEALKIGRSLPCFMNAVNEVLVDKFLKGKISFLDISKKLEILMSSHETVNMLDLNVILDVEKHAKIKAEKLIC